MSFMAESYNFIKKETLAQVVSREFCKFFRTSFLQNTSGQLPLSVERMNNNLVLFSTKKFNTILLSKKPYIHSTDLFIGCSRILRVKNQNPSKRILI